LREQGQVEHSIVVIHEQQTIFAAFDILWVGFQRHIGSSDKNANRKFTKLT
jgi:hypothetical protein